LFGQDFAGWTLMATVAILGVHSTLANRAHQPWTLTEPTVWRFSCWSSLG
jgi:hypothetical protein